MKTLETLYSLFKYHSRKLATCNFLSLSIASLLTDGKILVSLGLTASQDRNDPSVLDEVGVHEHPAHSPISVFERVDGDEVLRDVGGQIERVDVPRVLGVDEIVVERADKSLHQSRDADRGGELGGPCEFRFGICAVLSGEPFPFAEDGVGVEDKPLGQNLVTTQGSVGDVFQSFGVLDDLSP